MHYTDDERQMIKDIVDRIDVLRVESGFSIYELAQRANLSLNTLKAIFKKESYPNTLTVIRICEAVGVSAWEFFLFGKPDAKFSKAEIVLIGQYERVTQESAVALLEIARNLK